MELIEEGTGMTLQQYQDAATKTAIYPRAGEGHIRGLSYATLGLVGEAGEIANKVKKIDRDMNGHMTDDVRLALIKEVGDVLWYLAALCRELGTSLAWVGYQNMKKLFSRKERGVLGGSGDNR